MILIPKSWGDFQHYKDRAPPWIKLHKSLLDNYEFQCLPVASRAIAPMLWLLASDHERGEIDATPKKLAFRLRMTEREATDALKPLIDNGFFEVLHVDSGPLAERKRDAMPEERRGETETEKETEVGFEDFWKAWPKNERKQDKGKCLAKWNADKLDALADKILSDIAVKKETQKWRGGYIEAPLVYLNNQRWEDGVTPDATAGSQDPDSRASIEAEGAAKGIGKWDATVEQWAQYKARVRGKAQQQDPAIAAMVAGALKKTGVPA